MNDFERMIAGVDSDFFLRPPHTITLNVTYACHRHCVYCNIHEMVNYLYGSHDKAEKLYLDLATIKRVLSEARESGGILLRISGGEPFLRQDIYDVLRLGVSLGLLVFPITKHAFSEAEAEKLQDTGLAVIGVSFDSFTDDTNNVLHNTVAIKADLLKSIEILLHHGIRPVIAPVITNQNYAEYENLVARFCSMDVTNFEPMMLADITFAFRGSVCRNSSLLMKPVEEDAFRNSISQIHSKYNVTDGSPSVPREAEWACPSADHAFIMPDGHLLYCDGAIDLKLGNLVHKGFMDVWHSKERIELLRPNREKFEGTPCHRCAKFDLCNMIGRCYRRCLLTPPFYRDEKYRLCMKFQ